jgi:hypothetical protein
MSKRLKFFFAVLILSITSSFVVGYFMWNKPQRKVENEEGIKISAAQLVKDYQANEAEANKKYLDKAIEVSGTVTALKNNQEGSSTVTLASDDAFTGVFCTLKNKPGKITSGSHIIIKGICSGMLTDVRLREAVIVNK